MAEYIDKRKLMDDLNHFAPECKAALLIAEKQPIAEVEPVRHGHWIDSEDEYGSYSRCSKCGDEFTNWEGDRAHTDRCPTCGAHMDEVMDYAN